MTETFTRNQFEAVLPKHRDTGRTLWEARGLEQGEYTYFLPISKFAGVLIRSSVKEDGISAGTGKDSIRLWLVDPQNGEPVGSKLSKYIVRTANWQNRLLDQLRTLFRLARVVRPCGCAQGTVKIRKVTKDGVNKGRLFTSCSNRSCHVTRFQFLEESK